MPAPFPDPRLNSIYSEAAALEKAGTPFVLVVLVEALGSVPQDAGAKMLVTPAGLLSGTVGGGRVEARAVELAQEMLRDDTSSAPRFLNWSLKGDVGMTCGGSVKFYFELHRASPWTIAIFGTGHIAQALLPVLLPLPCSIICFDTRPEWVVKLPTAHNVQARVVSDLAAEIAALPDETFLLCMTQGHYTDRPVLQSALATRQFPYIGVIGSAAKAIVLRRELSAQGVEAERAAQFHCPVGLEFGTNHPHEIALSIAAQLLSERDRWHGKRRSAASALESQKAGA